MKISPFTFETLPIRTKLTVWYTISFMAVLAFSFISFYLVTQNLLMSKIDDSLRLEVEQITFLLKDQTISPASKEIIFRQFQAAKLNIVLILDADHQIIAQSQTVPIDQELLNKLLEKTESPEPQFLTIEKVRYYIAPIFNQGIRSGTIIVGDSIATINDAFAVLLNTLILVFFIFLLPLILVSFLEADISLAPLRELAKTVNTITTKNLSSRVEITNPKDEIGEVSTAINNLLDRLQKGFVQERQLIHDVSHQLKTPLTAMRSDIEIALTKKRSISIYQKILQNLLTDTTRMADILKDMMNLAWASSEEQDKHFVKLNLSQLLEEVSEIAQQLGIQKHLKILTNIIPDIYILGQKEKLFQIFLNLLENAIKYTQRGDKIIIQANYNQTQAKVIIKDTGIGILKKDLPNIFERFYRGENTSGEGSGLGLSIAAALVRAHKGKIEVTSQRNRGTVFVLTFPLETTLPISPSPTKLKIAPITLSRPHVRTFIREKLYRNSSKG